MTVSSLHQLRVLVTVARTGSFSAAARELGLTQPTLSTHLKRLEAETGAILIDRGGKKLRLTPAGQVLVDYGRRILALADEASDHLLRESCRPPAGILAIGGTVTAGEHVLPSLLTEYTGRYPGMEVQLVIHNTAEITRRVVDGELPLAVIAGDTDHGALEITTVAHDPQILIAAGTHPLAGAEASPQLLRGSRMLLREPGSTTRLYQERMVQRWRIPGLHVSTIASTSAIVGAVAHGLGISLVPEVTVQDALATGRLVGLRIEPGPEPRRLGLIRRRDRPLTVPEELFVDLVTERTGT
ncbi:LysR family transcriptional regulator [Nonomuraea sp. NPDC005650]|uniref:LysR family transcriptional regulator n=1 Tax=Nonomuraea sp. NPDC005650 TaxID=3157045 RepID=UPI0033AA4F0E